MAGVKAGFYGATAFSTLTIASGAITVTQTLHTVAAESGGPTDTLATITPNFTNIGTYRPFIVLMAAAGDIITLEHGTDANDILLSTGADFVLNAGDLIALWYDGTNWKDTASPSLWDGAPAGATMVVGAEGGSDDINVTVQLTDRNGTDLAIRGSVDFYLADDANGDTPSGTAPDGGIAIGTDGAMIEWAANLSGKLISESDGDIDITLIDSGTPTFYLVIVLPTGKLVVSDAITFA